ENYFFFDIIIIKIHKEVAAVLIKSLKTTVNTRANKDVEIIYNLFFKNALYSLECIKMNCNNKEPNNYCLVENFTEDETEAETILHILAKGMAAPIHIKDLIEDLSISLTY
ncbi:MAG: DUF6514 family protein, partial [Bacillota bacterium]|nr:DUF6514 family protein [Bacillota bacterium]